MSDFEKTYNVEIIIEEDINTKSRITYEVYVHILEELPSKDYLIRVVTNRFLINNRNPDTAIEQLAYKCRQAFEDIVLIVNRDGQIIGVNNHKEILAEWKGVKEKLLREYSGKVFEKYMKLMENTIVDPEVFLSGIRQDTFISQFYFPVVKSCFSGFSQKKVEQVIFFGIDYRIDVVLEAEPGRQKDETGNLSFIKTVDSEIYDFSRMPIDNYTTVYTVNRDKEILEIKGKFENHNRKYHFHIVSK